MISKSFLPVALLPLVAACSPAIITDIALSDIISVGDTGIERWTTARLHIPLHDGVDCDGRIEGLVTQLATLMPAANGICVMTAGSAHAEVDTSVAIIQSGGERPEKAGLVLEIGASIGSDVFYEVTAFSRVTLAEIEDALGLGKAVDPEIVFGVTNDLGRTMGMQFSSVFLDGEPAMLDQGPIKIDTETSIVVLSDVTTSVIAHGNGDLFMTIYDFEAPVLPKP